MWRTTGWVANEFGVTQQTIRMWLLEGKFEKTMKTMGGHYRIWWDV